MSLKLTVYKDEAFKEIDRVIEVEKPVIPYRVAMMIGQSLDGVTQMTNDDLFDFVIKNLDKLDRIMKATFGVTDHELDRVDVLELGQLGVELYKWAVEKFNSIKGGQRKNA